MKSQISFSFSHFSLSLLIVFCFCTNAKTQVLNDNPKNYYVESNEFQWDQLPTSGIPVPGIPAVRLATEYTDECSYRSGPGGFTPPLTLTPIQWTERLPLVDLNDDTNTDFDLAAAFWLNDPVAYSSPCEFTTFQQCFPIVGCLPEVNVDGYGSSLSLTVSTTIGDPVDVNVSVAGGLGPNSDFSLRSIWRYSNGDNFDSALDFGTVNSNEESHVNTNRQAPSGIPSSKGYTNHAGGSVSDVIYKFTVPAGNPRAVTISTDHPETNYDSFLRLYDSNETQITSNDDGGSNLTSKIDRVLAPGDYYVLVEGVGSSPRGNFRLSIDANVISLTAGSINSPSPAGYCYGDEISSITNDVAASLNFTSDVPISYKWFKKVGTGSFLVIPNATSASLSQADSGNINEFDVQFRRVAVVGSVESAPSNSVTATTQQNFGEVFITDNNGPICSGSDAIYTIKSENGSSDAGALVDYTLDGAATSGNLDSNGELIITSSAITSASTLTLISIGLNGCSLTLSETETIELIPTPTPLACGQSINGNNANGSDVILNYGIGSDEWSGKEDIYEFTVISDNMPIQISLTNMDLSKDLDLELISVCNPSEQLAFSENFNTDEYISKTLPSGNYYVVVDGYADTDESAYTITLESCGIQAACDAVIDLECFETISDDNTGNLLFLNSCGSILTGKLYKITPEVGGTMTLDLTGLNADLDMQLFDDICNTSCISLASSDLGGTSSEQIIFNSIVGGTTYYILVYGYQGAESSYSLSIDCPAGCACTNSVDYVEVVSNGEVCIGSTGSYLIQPVTGGSASPGATVTYSLNGGANQTVVLDGAGLATITDTPSSVGNPASTIALSKIEFGACNIILDTGAEFAANGFPTSFSVVSNNGLACVGGTGIYTIQGSPSVTNPTPFANVHYTLSVSGQPTVVDTIKLDANGLGIVEVPNLPSGLPASTIQLNQAEINGCIISLSNGNSIAPWEFAQPVTITPAPKDICPGENAVFNLAGRPGDVVEYDDTNSGSAPATPQTVQLDASGNATITVSNPTNNVRIDVYKVKYSPFNNSFFAPCTVDYEYGDNFAEVEIAQIGMLNVSPEAADICFGENAAFNITVPNGSLASPNGTLTYTLNGVTSTLVLDGNGEGQITDVAPAVGTSTITLNSLNVECDTGGCDNTFTGVTATVNIQAPPHAVMVTGNGPICVTDIAEYTIEPESAGMINPNAIVTYILNTSGIEETITLDGSGEITFTPNGPTLNSSIDLIAIQSSNSVCNTTINTGTNITAFEVPNTVEVIANSASFCGDSLITYTIQAPTGVAKTPNATVNYTVDGLTASVVLDTFGKAQVSSVSEAIGQDASSITLVSIENPGCTLALTSTTSVDIIDCGDPCYQYMVRNFGEEEANAYQVEGFIEASACIGNTSSPIDVSYSAGTTIDLLAGFEVTLGSTLECDINPCPATETCGLVLQQSPTGTGNVPNELLRWDVVEIDNCITELTFDINNNTPDVEIDMQGFVSGTSGSFYADLTVVSAGNLAPTTISIIVPSGVSTHNAGIYLSGTNRAYFVNITFDYDGSTLAEAFVEMQPL